MTRRNLLFALMGVLVGIAIASSSVWTTMAAPQKQPMSQSQGRRVINLPERSVQAPFSDAILVGEGVEVDLLPVRHLAKRLCFQGCGCSCLFALPAGCQKNQAESERYYRF